MKKTTIITIIGILFLSCNNPKTEKTTQIDLKSKIQDSLNRIETEKKILEKKKKDSIVRIEESKVLGDITFGMLEKNVKEKLNEFKLKNRRPDPVLGKPYYDDFIGEYEYSNVRGLYYDNKLYELKISGALIHWERYDYRVRKEAELISDVIKLKYGQPDLVLEIQPRYKIEKGYSYLIKRWNVGKKVIETRIEDIGTYYTVNVSIFLPEIRNRIKNEEVEKEKLSSEKAKDAF
jgi:hypothetical protein